MSLTAAVAVFVLYAITAIVAVLFVIGARRMGQMGTFVVRPPDHRLE